MTKQEQVKAIWEDLQDTDASGNQVVAIWDLQQEVVRRIGKRLTDREVEELHQVGLRLRPVSHLGNLEDWHLEYTIAGMNETLAYVVAG